MFSCSQYGFRDYSHKKGGTQREGKQYSFFANVSAQHCPFSRRRRPLMMKSSKSSPFKWVVDQCVVQTRNIRHLPILGMGWEGWGCRWWWSERLGGQLGWWNSWERLLQTAEVSLKQRQMLAVTVSFAFQRGAIEEWPCDRVMMNLLIKRCALVLFLLFH